ncbi:MAG: hypothetical protein ACOYXW_18125 [Actinomycetota bacterium]
MLEVTGDEVLGRDADETLLLEGDVDLPVLVVDGDDSAEAPVLHGLALAWRMQRAVVAAGDDLVADQEVASVGHQRLAGQNAFGPQQRAGTLVERSPSGVGAGEHR